MTKLGKNQQGVLECLVESGKWPAGWIWENDSTTTRLLDTLVKRGLAVRNATVGDRLIDYRPTNDGILEAKGSLDWRPRRDAALAARRKEAEDRSRLERLRGMANKNVVVLTDDELYALNMSVMYVADGEDNEVKLKHDLWTANKKFMEADELMQERQIALAEAERALAES